MSWRSGARRATTVRAGTAALAATALLAAAAPAQGATTNYPAGGSSFSGGADGWTGSDASCSPLSGVGSLCTAANTYDGAVGNPAGSIATNVDVTVNALTLFRGTGTWTSPPFTVPAGGPVTGATFQYDRRFDVGGLLSLAPSSTVDVTLVDQTAGSTSALPSETLDFGDSVFATRGVGVPAGVLTSGHTYALQLETTTTSTVALGVLGKSHTRFDNVRLAVDRAGSGGGGGGGGGGGDTPIVSPGVTIVRASLSNSEINSLFNRYNENTEVGSGPGGSLVPLARCTIVGTSRADRIKGTRGNDVICGLGGNDVINGAGGIDIIDGANGNDRLSGGSRKDKLIGLRGKDRLNGNSGNDRAGGGAGNDRVSGSSGKDRFGGGSGKDRLSGGSGRDRLNGGKGNDRIGALDRMRDRVDGGSGRDSAAVNRTDRVRRVERLL
ncbi:MAG: hypothetical protein M3550_11475 [Actinomycetota bacterium]|nr:hypothetical protein [Actinomycetota bacterium]